MDVGVICRVCLGLLNESVVRKPLGKLQAMRLALCAGLRHPHPDDGLPGILCMSCYDELTTAAAFRRKARKSDRTLRERLPLVKSEIIPAIVEESDVKSQPEDAHDNDEPPHDFDPETIENVECKLEVLEIEYSPEKATVQKCICDQCGKPLSSEHSLSQHKKNMHSEKRTRVGKVTGYGADKRFHCTECSYSTPRSQSLVYHIRIHTGEKPLQCDKCDKRFAQPASLASHIKIHSSETFFECKECAKQFKHRKTFLRHKDVHSSQPLFICAICNKGLKSKKTLEGHLNRHYNIRNYSCETCGAQFVTRVELLNHARKHSSSREFACNFCNFRTYMKKSLANHLKRHMGEREFKCDHCSFACYSQGELKCHAQKHNKEKNYSCPVCQVKFKHSSSVNKHTLKVHGAKYNWMNPVDRRIVK